MLNNFARLNLHLSDPSDVIEIPLFYYRFMVHNYSVKPPFSFFSFLMTLELSRGLFFLTSQTSVVKATFYSHLISLFTAILPLLNKLWLSILMLGFVCLYITRIGYWNFEALIFLKLPMAFSELVMPHSPLSPTSMPSSS